MSDAPASRSIYYFDVVAVLAVAIIVLGHALIRGTPAADTVTRDVVGFWVPLAAVALLLGLRRRAYTEHIPWIAGAFAGLMFVGLVGVYWRGNTAVFLGAISAAALLLPAGLILRTRRILEPLVRTDLFALIVLTAGVCIGLALTEVLLRLGAGLFDEETRQVLRGADMDNLGVPHAYIGYLHTPNNALVMSGRDFHAVHNVDGLGFRNRWPWPEQADIVAVGDSLTFGQGVQDDEAWPFLVAQNMACRVVNLGLIGAGPTQYLRIFETYGLRLRPKVLLVGVFARNDFWDTDAFHRWLESGLGGNFMVWRGSGQPPPVRFSIRDPRDTLDRVVRSLLVPAMRRSYTLTLVRALQGGTEGETAGAAQAYTFADGRRVLLFERDFLDKTLTSRPGRRPFRLVLESLQAIHALAAEEGARTLVVLLPGKEEVYLPLLGRTPPDPTSALRSALDERRIEYLDLAPAFRARAEAEPLFFEVDGHPNRTGYALIAAEIQRYLEDNAERYGLIPLPSGTQ